jgi:hypothetical protein
LCLSQQQEEKKRKRERSEMEPEVMDQFHPNIKVEVEQQGDRPVRACRTAPGNNLSVLLCCYVVTHVITDYKLGGSSPEC